ncbi:hypothetical protein [Roseobacter ponti]|uniref:Uncharacterized protein n=1 Tax=Roseobacter ponti TaxID=1891787 RepID=A0A858SR59_9RHOB|nr:hypothetical protein [Roseobacter ponti]QJF50111.1 hypothetical protein G3256_02470 [Roseobacter ponti]
MQTDAMNEGLFSPGMRAFLDNPMNGVFIALFILAVVWLIHQLTHHPRRNEDDGSGSVDGGCSSFSDGCGGGDGD